MLPLGLRYVLGGNRSESGDNDAVQRLRTGLPGFGAI